MARGGGGGRWAGSAGWHIFRGFDSRSVPANAKIHIDFLGGSPQGRAWSNGAEIAIDTLLGSDPNAVNGRGDTAYNPGYIGSFGYQVPSEQVDPGVIINVAFIGAARTALLDAATFVIREKLNSHDVTLVGTINIELLSEDGNDAAEIDVGYPAHSVSGYTWNGAPALDLLISNILNESANGAVNVLAATITSTRMDIAVNGSTAQTGTMDSSMRPPGNPLVAAIFICDFRQAIQSITIYDPLPSTTGLSALSVVG